MIIGGMTFIKRKRWNRNLESDSQSSVSLNYQKLVNRVFVIFIEMVRDELESVVVNLFCLQFKCNGLRPTIIYSTLNKLLLFLVGVMLVSCILFNCSRYILVEAKFFHYQMGLLCSKSVTVWTVLSNCCNLDIHQQGSKNFGKP